MAPIPENENERLAALRRYGLLDTPAERSFDDITRLASYICETPMAMMTLVDANRQWFKASVGTKTKETPRDQAFCAHTILQKEVMIVEDATRDERFAENPLVTAFPQIRFYAGAPLIDREGFGLGSLCVIGTEPRQLTAPQHQALEALARQVVEQCEFRRVSAELASALDHIKTLHGLLPICSHCKNVKSDDGYWDRVENFVTLHTEASFTHGICPECLKDFYPEAYTAMLQERPGGASSSTSAPAP